jgi:hypothetical protein
VIASGNLAFGAAAVALALLSFSNVWNLGRFISAQADPSFRIREYK